MKEISEELEKDHCLICVTCGAIFKGSKKFDPDEVFLPCPGCGAERWGLRWLTPSYGWIEAWTRRYKEALDELATGEG